MWLTVFINAMLPIDGGERKKKRALPRTSFVSLQDKTAKQYLQGPLLSCCLLYMHTKTQKVNIHSEVGNEEFHWLVQDSSCFVNQQTQSFLW